jgi:hypothetical protein
MIHNRQTIVSPFYFKIVYMKFLFEMLFQDFSTLSLRNLFLCCTPHILPVLYFSDGLSDWVSNNFLCLYLFLNSYWNSFQQLSKANPNNPVAILRWSLHSANRGCSIIRVTRRHASLFFYKLVSSSDFVYRSDNYFREPVHRTIDRPIVGFVNTEKTEFEAENRKLENWKAEENQVCTLNP